MWFKGKKRSLSVLKSNCYLNVNKQNIQYVESAANKDQLKQTVLIHCKNNIACIISLQYTVSPYYFHQLIGSENIVIIQTVCC